MPVTARQRVERFDALSGVLSMACHWQAVDPPPLEKGKPSNSAKRNGEAFFYNGLANDRERHPLLSAQRHGLRGVAGAGRTDAGKHELCSDRCSHAGVS